MKKKVFILITVLALAFSEVFAAQLVGSPAATVNLIRNKAISNTEVDEALKQYQDAGMSIDRAQVLDVLINDEVFLQGAERDGINITDSQVESAIKQTRASLEQQIGQSLTDEQFAQLILEQTGMDLASYKQALKEQLIVNQYLMLKKGAELEAMDFTPSKTEVENYYRKNKQSFYSPENVKLAHVFKQKTGDSAVDEKNAAMMVQLAADIKSGKTTFEQAVVDYTDDAESKNVGGDIGWLTIDNQTARIGFGDDFVDTVVSMKAGEISPMLESNVGYHIVKISVHNDGKLLNIDDPVSPVDTATVRDYIAALLANQKMQTATNNALNSLINELRGQARIRIY